MKVIQVLPNLNSGGVERGTIDFANYLISQGHQSIVISNGGRLVEELTQQGSKHIQYPVHAKSLKSFLRIKGLSKLIIQEKPDAIHVRSRIPAWMIYLALKKIPKEQRPKLISTFHGMYSISPYSAIMGCGEQVIVISEAVKKYVTDNYPKIDSKKLNLIYRGVDTTEFNTEKPLCNDWLQEFNQLPVLKNKQARLLMPGRLSQWKGQQAFIQLIDDLKQQDIHVAGLIVGDVTPGKDDYLKKLKEQIATLGLNEYVAFLGHRNDMKNLYQMSDIVYNLSEKPEPFGRTVIEAMAMQKPVIAYNEGGPAESLAKCFPQGLIEKEQQLLNKTIEILNEKPQVHLSTEFTMATQCAKTITLYQQLLGS